MAQRIRPRRQAILNIVRVGRGIPIRIGHRQQVAVGIVRKTRHASPRIGDFGDPVQGIIVVHRGVSVGIGHRNQSGDVIVRASGSMAKGVNGGRKITECVIFKLRGVS